ncbi:LURP-one-related/scramblase family protein [Clostridium grantii]|uniref:Uncharacterized protein YxjI n=1 Tax=Clostridium grantii DSM 8605 TaxID=1121316 RepID=A0A1M5WUH0_9CLOT|nr:LURP-one-related family protein [Clostridium grantii]SHH91068.1 Uncharacterized protein YxjI [Clostridium grantii DSM 8605]
MRYNIKQKIFSFGDNFYVKDDRDNNIFKIQGKVFALGDKLKLCDMQGKELIYIQQKLFKLLPEYNLFRNDVLIAKVKKELSFFKPKFVIESMMGNYRIEGEIFSHNFSVTKAGRTVAVVNKKWISFSDTYGVEIDDNEDQAFMVSLVIVIDQVIHDNNSNNN